MFLAITVAHYVASPEAVEAHNVFRRLYYVPIVWGALLGGLPGGLGVAALTTAAYSPHAFMMHSQHDPASTSDKLLEVLLYFGVGALAGALVDRERRARTRQERESRARAAAEARADRLAGLVHLSRGLAHEIRNPLGGIQGAIEILADEIPLTSPRREMIDVGLRETSRLDAVVSHFLDFARPRDPVMKPFAVEDVIRDVVDLQVEVARRKGVELSSRVNGQGRALGDVAQVTQILLNLVRNALQATPSGGRVVVESGGGPPDRVVFRVADTGPGVPQEMNESIYDPYVSGREGGLGLGLSISAMLARQNGGSLRHEPQPGGGVVFELDVAAYPRPGRDEGQQKQ